MTGYQNYAKTSIQTADPRAVIVLLYEGSLNFLNQATAALENNDRSGMSNYINRTLRIINHLSSALDFEHGQDIADNLLKLYNYIRDTLTEANIHCDAKKIEDAAAVLRTLLEAWREIAKDPVAGAALQGERSASVSEPAATSAVEPAAEVAKPARTLEDARPSGSVYPIPQKKNPFAKSMNPAMVANSFSGFREVV